jgi:two-component system nitrate/nitrite response regulator NarL
MCSIMLLGAVPEDGRKMSLNGSSNHERTADHAADSGVAPSQTGTLGPRLDALIHVHIVAPTLLGWGLKRLLRSAGPPFLVTASSPTLSQAMPLLELDPPDVILLDLDEGYGPEHVADLHTRLRAKVLVLTCASDGKLLDRIVQAGARGILRKHDAPPQLLDAVETVGRGATFASRSPAQRLPMTPAVEQASRADQGKLATLTRRERESVEALVSNASAPVKVIADGLGISEHTLRNHLCTVYSKLGVRSRLELHAFAADLLDGAKSGTC